MDLSRFYVVLEGKIQGPLSLEELQDLPLKHDDFVKCEGEVDFLELQEHKQIATLLQVPYRRTPPQYFASLDMRLLAWFIDFMLVFFAYCICWGLPVLLWAPKEAYMEYLMQGSLGIPLLLGIGGILCEQSHMQGTPGKYWLKIKVSTEAGLALGLGQALVRNLFKLIGFLSLGLFFLLGFLDRRQQCLHDKIAGTLVIKNRLLAD